MRTGAPNSIGESSGSGATVPQALQGDRVGREELAAAKLRFVDFTVTLRRRVWLCGHLRRDIWVPLRWEQLGELSLRPVGDTSSPET